MLACDRHFITFIIVSICFNANGLRFETCFASNKWPPVSFSPPQSPTQVDLQVAKHAPVSYRISVRMRTVPTSEIVICWTAHTSLPDRGDVRVNQDYAPNSRRPRTEDMERTSDTKLCQVSSGRANADDATPHTHLSAAKVSMEKVRIDVPSSSAPAVLLHARASERQWYIKVRGFIRDPGTSSWNASMTATAMFRKGTPASVNANNF